MTAPPRRRAWGHWFACCWLLVAAFVILLARPAAAQVSPGSVPSQMYFNTLPLYIEGNYRNAANAFRMEARNSLKSGNRQWVDAIPYYTMAGESYYQLGQYELALGQYNAALELYVAYSDWMMRVQFPQVISPALNAVRATPWGQSKRGAPTGAFSETFLMSQGQVNNSATIRQGGVMQQAVTFPVHAAELVRCTSLAIRRRLELMGPLCKHDPLTNNLVDVLARRPGPPNHWTDCWIKVQLGCAYAAAGSLPQAKTALEAAVLANGQFDHPLTSTALLELARISLETGDFPAAGRFAEEASYACANFPNPGNLEEAFRTGLLAHLLLNQKTPYPPIAPAIIWSKAQGLRHLNSSLLLMAAENMAVGGQASQAAGFLTTARAVMGRSDLVGSQVGARMNYLTSLVSYQTGNVQAGDQALAQTLTFQRTGSLWNFQIALADARYLSGGNGGERVSLQLYETLLRDPTPADWASNPLECLSMLTVSHDNPLEHWFELAFKNGKEPELALEVADRARRHRFYSTLPMGGRLLSLRWVLEGPVSMLGEQGTLERQELLARYPKYAQLATQAAELRTKLAAKPVVDNAPEARQLQGALLTSLAEISAEQEVILREIAVRRESAAMVFPPQRKAKEIQESLRQGEVMLAFFSTSRHLYAFLYSHDRRAAWKINSPAQLQKQVSTLLRELGNYDANHELTSADLDKSGWRTAGAKIMSLLVDRSNVDMAGNFEELVVVPDGFLWYLPFEALTIGKPDKQKLMMAQSRVRYAPTVGLAVPYGGEQKPQPTVGVALGRLYPQDADSVTAAAFEILAPAVNGAVALPKTLTAPASVYRVMLDGLIVLDDIEPDDLPYDWSPLQLDRGKPGANLTNWFTLPFGGPRQIILPGYHTGAEVGIRKGPNSGNEVFLSLCGLMSTGARTVLLSRWRPGGQTSFDLIREFAQELPHTSAAEAWQRSVQIASEAPVEADREPRVKDTPSGAAIESKADHPFFWAAYMLVDSGAPSPESATNDPKGEPAKPKRQPANPPINSTTGPRSGGPVALTPPQNPAGDAADESPTEDKEEPAKGSRSKSRPKSKAKPAPKPKSKASATEETTEGDPDPAGGEMNDAGDEETPKATKPPARSKAKPATKRAPPRKKPVPAEPTDI